MYCSYSGSSNLDLNCFLCYPLLQLLILWFWFCLTLAHFYTDTQKSLYIHRSKKKEKSDDTSSSRVFEDYDPEFCKIICSFIISYENLLVGNNSKHLSCINFRFWKFFHLMIRYSIYFSLFKDYRDPLILLSRITRWFTYN